jgi:spore coat polysaccharide biosynthesis predicted glycosyltransferase SpsG
MLCLIPARGGSKTVRRKNLRTIGGKTLVQIAVEACRPHGRVIVSTDDAEIAAVARMCGAEVWDRPAELATDDASIDDLVRWVRLQHPEPLLVYQPTVPQAACVLAAFIEDWKRTGGSSSMGTPHRHIVWGANQTRAQRQNLEPLTDEIGVRLYAEGSDNLDRVWLSPLPLTDIDTPADLHAVRLQPRRILFRVIASKRLGSGHVRRCVQIADELQHHQIAFAPHPASDVEMVASLCGGYPLVADGWPHDLCVNDVLDTSEQDMLEQRFASPVVALEDCGPGARHASLVINELYGTQGALCGPDWAVLRPVFTAAPAHRFDHTGRPRLLVSFGGTDPGNLSEKLRLITESLWGFDTVIVPPPTQGTSAEMASLLCWADLVVCSGGRTVWEAMVCGTPAVVLCQNPREMTHTHLSPAFGVLNLGLGKLVDDAELDRTLRTLLEDRQLLVEMSERMRGVVDGRGVWRIAHRIEGLLEGL